MGVATRILISIFVILIILGGLYVYSLSQVKIQGVTINDLQDISVSGFTLGGDIVLYNGGILPVGVDHISYDVILEDSGNKLANGNIDGKLISPKQTTNFPFSNKINWVPTSEVAWGLITPGRTYAKVKGIIYVADLKVIDFKIPFEVRLDLEQYIRQFAQRKIEEAIDKVTNTITNVVNKVGEGIKGITGKVVDGLGKIFG